MRAIRLSFLQMLKFIRHDMMLFAACLAPILAGLAIKWGIPLIEKMLVRWAGKCEIIFPYYALFDIFFSMLAPIMFCFTAAMVVLEEHDEHIENYLFVTRLGRMGYIVSRIYVPAFIAFLVTFVLLPFFSLTSLSFPMIAFLSLTGALQGIIIALLVVTLSANKLEGMAVTKISTLTVFGVFAPYFIPIPLQYILAFLPSFWTGKAICEQSFIYMFPSILLACVWIFLLNIKFKRKMT